ncbi:dihydrofolate reductase [Eisenibacter elegans]|jgi:dihydrofolate reductase|uniref:dihydrofolate reductase n=1 Tax=Eisenibacter elegans TaxID=997 RepID=UPI000550283E|nr:dihydrofolate reductase [Eisenibacter elegans]
MQLILIVAVAQNGVIGHKNQLPWHLPADLKHFKATTLGQAIVMGRKTFESIGRPLPKRLNIVLTRQANYPAPEGIATCTTLAAAQALAAAQGYTQLFVIGGGELYAQALPLAHKIILTAVAAQPEGDAFFPTPDPAQWQLTAETPVAADTDNQYPFTIQEWVRRG